MNLKEIGVSREERGSTADSLELKTVLVKRTRKRQQNEDCFHIK